MQLLLDKILAGHIKSLARAITLIEQEKSGFENLLINLPQNNKKIIGITGPPGAGKSTLTDALIQKAVDEDKSIAVLCIDPASPSTHGALLGDRVRMSRWFTHPKVYIRSLSNRGIMGGLHPKAIEITDLLKAFPFHYLLVETVGVGQSEIDIAGLADLSIVVLTPEGGDEIQMMKTGLMEIADIFIINKADRPNADEFVKHLRRMAAPAFAAKAIEIPILKTIATQQQGVEQAWEIIKQALAVAQSPSAKAQLLAEKAYQLIIKQRMKGIDKEAIKNQILADIEQGSFNLYRFVETVVGFNPKTNLCIK